MKFFITGNLGFIGSALVKELLKNANNCIIGYDLKEDEFVGLKTGNYISIQGDMRNYELLFQSIPSDTDTIIHLAAEHKDEGLIRDDYFSVNVDGTQNLLKAAQIKKIKKLIFFSSSAIYGNNQFSNEKTIANPINDYGKSKYMAEMIVEKWAKKKENKAIILRPSAVYGPWNTANIYKFIKSVYENKFFLIGKGKNIKSFIYIRNLVDATLFSIKNISNNLTHYNLVDEPQITIREFADLIRKATGRKKIKRKLHIPLFLGIPIVFIIEKISIILKIKPFITRKKLKKFVSNSTIDGTAIKKNGFIQNISTEQGINETINWIDRGKKLNWVK